MMDVRNELFEKWQLAYMVKERMEWSAKVMGCKVTHVAKITGCGSEMVENYVCQMMNRWAENSNKENTISKADYIRTINMLDYVRSEYLNIYNY